MENSINSGSSLGETEQNIQLGNVPEKLGQY